MKRIMLVVLVILMSYGVYAGALTTNLNTGQIQSDATTPTPEELRQAELDAYTKGDKAPDPAWIKSNIEHLDAAQRQQLAQACIDQKVALPELKLDAPMKVKAGGHDVTLGSGTTVRSGSDGTVYFSGGSVEIANGRLIGATGGEIRPDGSVIVPKADSREYFGGGSGQKRTFSGVTDYYIPKQGSGQKVSFEYFDQKTQTRVTVTFPKAGPPAPNPSVKPATPTKPEDKPAEKEPTKFVTTDPTATQKLADQGAVNKNPWDALKRFRESLRRAFSSSVPQGDIESYMGGVRFVTLGDGTIISGGVGVAIHSDGFSVDSAQAIEHRGSTFSNVADVYASGDDIFIGSGDLVVDGEDYYFNVRNSMFSYENGRIKVVQATSAMDNNTFIIKNTFIVADKDQSFDVGYYDDGMSILSDDKIYFESLESGETIEVNSTLSVINYEYGTGVTCATLGSTGRYKYAKDQGYDPFSVYIPPESDFYKLCIKKLPQQEFDTGCIQCGLVDFVNRMSNMSGIYDYEKHELVLKTFTDIIDAEESQEIIAGFDSSMRVISRLSHEGNKTHYYSGPFEIYYDEMPYFRFFDYRKPYTIRSIEPGIRVEIGNLFFGPISKYNNWRTGGSELVVQSPTPQPRTPHSATLVWEPNLFRLCSRG